MKNFENYTLGVDIGTGSVGWAAINGKYNLLKLNGKDAWGALLFDDAKTAIERRQKRSQRRRYERRNYRIRLLQDLMNDLVLMKDNSFFIKLKESYLRSDVIDSNYCRKNYYNLFEGDFTDKDFYKQFKTIYHLRQHLCTSNKKEDIRFVYLAIHHIIKYRGNFLYEGKSINLDNSNLFNVLSELFVLLNEKYNKDLYYVDKIDEIVSILKNKKYTKSVKVDNCISIFNCPQEKKFIESIFKVLLGYKVDLNQLIFTEKPLDCDNKYRKFSFADNGFDEIEEQILEIADEKAEIILMLKKIYNAIIFEDIVDGKKSISQAMIAKYEKHSYDLKVFKRLLKKSFPIEINPATGCPFYTEYSKMFRSKHGNNYVNYIGSITKNNHYEGKITKDIFYDAVKKLLSQIDDCDDKEYCLQQIELDNFLPKINTVANAVIPYQMHLAELNKIIDNQSSFYPQLGELKDKIISIFSFKRPYFVGTLKGKYSWNNQITNEKITPWNFKQLVNEDSLAETFINRMTNKCAFFNDEECLPLNSIVYQSYVTLNEINKIKYKNQNICVEWKKAIFLNLCCKIKTIHIIDICKYLANEFNIHCSESDISGIADEKLNGNMSTLIKFKSILKDKFNSNYLKTYEEIIRILTLFDDEKIRYNRIKQLNIYPNQKSNDNEIAQLVKMQLKKWGKFSFRLLMETYSINKKSILELMFETNKNFNEIIYDESIGIKQQIIKDLEVINDFNYERDVQGLYCSPSVKKAIWNTLKIIQEIEKIAKKAPSYIFLEVTHEENEKKKTESRTKQLLVKYKDILKSEYYIPELLNYLKELDSKNDKCESEKLYLYLLQLGRCMYSGESLDIDRLSDYEVDHIIPRCYIKDDSIENKVLVKKIENQIKTDSLSINPNIIVKMREFWDFLYTKKFIGSKKYSNLIRSQFTESDKIGFINRQLVETSQIIKEVKNILKSRYPDTKIEGIRASLNSQMRAKYREQNKAGFYKLRNLNNFHHAKDAYLTAVLGQFTTVACPLWGQDSNNKYIKYFLKNNELSGFDVKTLVNKRYGIILDLMENGNLDNFQVDDNGEYLWNNDTYINIFKTMEKNNCLIVKKKPFMANTKFYNETIISPLLNKKLIPLKNKNGVPLPTKYYGGYSNENAAYFAIIKYEYKTKKISVYKYKLINIPVMVEWKSKSDNKAIEEYVHSLYGVNAEYIKKVYKYQKIIYNGHLCYIASDSELNNAVELYVDPKFERLLYLIEKDNLAELKGKNKLLYEELMKEFIVSYSAKVKRWMPEYKSAAEKCTIILNDLFDELTIEEKCNFIKNLLLITDTKAGRVTLDEKLGKGNFGRLAGKNIIPNEVIWIDESCTGLYSAKKNGKLWLGES